MLFLKVKTYKQSEKLIKSKLSKTDNFCYISGRGKNYLIVWIPLYYFPLASSLQTFPTMTSSFVHVNIIQQQKGHYFP